MGRVLMYGAIAALAVFILSATFVLQHGGESVASVQRVSVHDLTTNPGRYEGDPVTTTGRLSYSEEHERFQIVEVGNHAVIISGYHGASSLEELEGESVRVNGIFGINEEFGVHIEAEYVVAVLD